MGNSKASATNLSRIGADSMVVVKRNESLTRSERNRSHGLLGLRPLKEFQSVSVSRSWIPYKHDLRRRLPQGCALIVAFVMIVSLALDRGRRCRSARLWCGPARGQSTSHERSQNGYVALFGRATWSC